MASASEYLHTTHTQAAFLGRGCLTSCRALQAGQSTIKAWDAITITPSILAPVNASKQPAENTSGRRPEVVSGLLPLCVYQIVLDSLSKK
jgi:hypothetical protein